MMAVAFGTPVATPEPHVRDFRSGRTESKQENNRRLPMSALLTRKRRTKIQPCLENLDMRIAPTAMATAAALANALKVETRQIARWETALATATPGSHHQQVLLNHIARTEHRMGVQEARLARIQARALARAQASSPFRMADPPPTPVQRTPAVMPLEPTAPASLAVSSAASSVAISDAPTVTTSTTLSGGGGTDSGSTSSLPPNASKTLDVIYDAYTQDPSGFPANLPATNGANLVVIQGSNVGIQVHDNNPADFNTLVSELQADGMQINSSSATYGLVVGLLPIAQLPAVAALPGAPSVNPIFQPILR
jgi:hypothetical protein